MSSPILTRDMDVMAFIEVAERESLKSGRKFGLDCYTNQIELITAEHMLDAFASHALPIMYPHWSFGKSFVRHEADYRKGRSGLAYEVVINSNPCISYLMENNTMPMQLMVIAHACAGHNSFFKNNYMFKEWTEADAIIEYLAFAKNYILACEEKHGRSKVERILDMSHAFMHYGVDKHKRPPKLSVTDEKARAAERAEAVRLQYNELSRTIPKDAAAGAGDKEKNYPAEPESNLLYFIEKNAPKLEVWEREIVRIVRKLSQYFYPQGRTKIMNEGWAMIWEHIIGYDLYEQGIIDEGFMMDYLIQHTTGLIQRDFDHKYYNGFNPYALGHAIFRDIRRMSEHPTDEDREWFPEIAGRDWMQNLDFAMRNFKDASFIQQYLSPKVIRDQKLFAIDIREDDKSKVVVNAIHNDEGYRQVRRQLAEQQNIDAHIPDIQIRRYDRTGDRTLTLVYHSRRGKKLTPESRKCFEKLKDVWGFGVVVETLNEKGDVTDRYCP